MRVFQANQCRKDSFLIFWIEKKKFQTRKVKFQKGPKNQIFQRGQSMVFVKKLGFYHARFLGKPRKKRSLFNILYRKNKFQFRKVKFQKGPKNRNFQRGQLVHVFCQKIELFTKWVFQANQGRKDCFFHILDRKEYFWSTKVNFLKNV